MDKISLTKKEFDELYTITDEPPTEKTETKEESVLTEEEEEQDKVFLEEYQ